MDMKWNRKIPKYGNLPDLNTGNVVVGSYKRGQTVTILEQTRVGVTLWGRTDKGWICMDYVK